MTDSRQTTASNNNTAGKKRKRGIAASRVKLEQAMRIAGLKTQTSLAEKIADTEDLDNVPRDMVNRVFRGLTVEPQTIERIAVVLDVEAYSLYLSSDELEQAKQTSGENATADYSHPVSPKLEPSQRDLAKSDNISSTNLITVAVLAIIVLIIFWSVYSRSTGPNAEETLSTGSPMLGKPSLVVYSFSKVTDVLANELVKQMQDDFTAINLNREVLTGKNMAVDIAREYQSDGVLTLREQTFGRFIGLQAYLYINDVELLIWTDSLLKASLPAHRKTIAKQLIKSVNIAVVDPQRLNSSGIRFVDPASQQKFLRAITLLNNTELEINVKRAQALLQSAIQKHPNYVNAITALCESFVEESWRGNEQEILQDAQRVCNKALSIDPTNIYAQSTLAYVYRRTGRLEKSIRLYENALAIQPNDINANSGIASAYLEAYRQNLNEYPNAKKKMVQYARKAVELEPSYWKHHSNLGLFNYFSGNSELAADAFGIAAELNPNELAYTNVGTMNRCIGNIDKAEFYYRKAIDLAPNSYLGKEFLGSIFFYKNQFSESADLKKQALDAMSNESGGIHQMWGELGHAYRKDHQTSNAIDSYLKALKIVERDALRGNIAVADKIFNYQYKLLLTTLAPETYSKSNFNLDSAELAKLLTKETDGAALAALAHSFLIEGDMSRAKKAFDRAMSKCIVYKSHPDLISLTTQ